MNREAFLHGVVDELGKCASVDTVSDLFAFLRREGHRVSTSPLDKQMKARFGPKGMGKKANGDEEEENKGPAPSEEDVIKFLKKHPSPRDEVFHEWAEENGFNVHKAEAVAYKIISDLVTKGRSKGKTPSNVDKVDQARGVDIEKEHTPNMLIRQKIRNDHNEEFKQYYDKRRGLPALEDSLKKGKMAKKAEEMVRCPVTGKMVPRGRGRQIMRKMLSKKAEDTITTDVPLFIRLMEWAHEDAKTDMQLHKATKKLISMGKKPHTMEDYDAAVGGPGMPPLLPVMGKKAGARKTLKTVGHLGAAAAAGAGTLHAVQALRHKKKKKMDKKAVIVKSAAFMEGFLDELEKEAGPPTLSKLRHAYPKGKVKLPKVADPKAVPKKLAIERGPSPDFPKAATLSGRVKYLLKRLAAPIRRLQAGDKGRKAMDEGKMRKALRYGSVSAGLGPSFGREPKNAKRLMESLSPAPAKA